MDSLDLLAFVDLFKEACLKCFGTPLKEPLSEAESKQLYNRLFEQTGLIVGWKSIKNYSFFVVDQSSAKRENPSVSTLDTLSRYVMDAPYITETERKKKEDHYPYWFRYKACVHRSDKPGSGGVAGVPPGVKAGKSPGVMVLLILLILLILAAVMSPGIFRKRMPDHFTDNFHTVNQDSLAARGWFLKDKDVGYWRRRGEYPGALSLFTLKGDNWPDAGQTLGIRNLLLHTIPCECFVLELHMKAFVPTENWQQAGILLLEDTGLIRKSIRISLAYNDYTGGFPKTREILIQAITSLGNNSGKPEEIAHIPLYNVDSLNHNPVLYKNLDNSALRIEKHGDRFRFLYSTGISANTSFKEIATHEFSMSPRYAGLFALKGFVDQANEIPVRIQFFSLDCESCDGGR
jgi:hypothetical protein